MPEVAQKKLEQPQKVKEAEEATIKRLTEENEQLRLIAEKAINENNILRATVKALSQLI